MLQQNAGSGNWVKWIVWAVFMLLIAAVVFGLLLAGTYWANPSLGEAEAETVRIGNAALEDQRKAEADEQRLENKIAEETWEIESAARRKKIEDDSWARREKAAQGMQRAERWNELLMSLAPTLLVILTLGALIIAAAVILGPRLQEMVIELGKVRLRQKQEDFRLKQLDVQLARTLEKAGGNGNGHRAFVEQAIIPTHIAARTSPTLGRN